MVRALLRSLGTHTVESEEVSQSISDLVVPAPNECFVQDSSPVASDDLAATCVLFHADRVFGSVGSWDHDPRKVQMNE